MLVTTLEAALLAVLLTRPVPAEDRASPRAKQQQYEDVARDTAREALAQKVTLPVEWAALILTVGESESGWSLRIHDGKCKPSECDRGRARGPFQVHAYADAKPVWEQMHGTDNTALQVQVASKRLLRGYYTCRGAQDWLLAAINGYAGVRCDKVWPGLEKRAALWRVYRAGIGRELKRAAKEKES